jgi:prepilin-type N-terminal cleavage/methylation domain-containing protein
MMPRHGSTRPDQGFTLIEVLVSMMILGVGTVALASLLVRAARQSTDTSARVYQTNAMAEEMDRLGSVPFSLLPAGTTCVDVTAHPLPHTRCSIISDITTKRKLVKVRITPNGNALLAADSIMFERSISGSAAPPLGSP